jgi:hypothetical protein
MLILDASVVIGLWTAPTPTTGERSMTLNAPIKQDPR